MVSRRAALAGRGLGLARDWDVLLADNLPVALAQFAGHPAEAALRHFAANSCRRGTPERRRCCSRAAYQALLLAFGRQFALLADTVTGGRWQAMSLDALEANDQKLRKRLQRIDSGDAAALHRTRILVEASALSAGGQRELVRRQTFRSLSGLVARLAGAGLITMICCWRRRM